MNRNSRKKLIYIRYIFPVVAIFLSFLLMLVPCYSYTTAETGAQEAISLCELLDNARMQVCDYLFERVGTKDDANVYFSRLVLGLIAGFSVLFALAFVSTVYILISALRHFKNPDDVGTARLWFVTLIPNRTVGFVLQALVFPMLAFPHIMALLYDSLLHYHVTVSLTFPDPLILSGVLYIGAIVLSCISASHETGLRMNPFARLRPAKSDDEDEEE